MLASVLSASVSSAFCAKECTVGKTTDRNNKCVFKLISSQPDCQTHTHTLGGGGADAGDDDAAGVDGGGKREGEGDCCLNGYKADDGCQICGCRVQN